MLIDGETVTSNRLQMEMNDSVVEPGKGNLNDLQAQPRLRKLVSIRFKHAGGKGRHWPVVDTAIT